LRIENEKRLEVEKLWREIDWLNCELEKFKQMYMFPLGPPMMVLKAKKREV